MENNMTASNLRSAHAGESMAYMRYRVWGEHAKKEGFPNVGRLFEAIAFAERVHASNHFKELKDLPGDFGVSAMGGFGLGSTVDNLAGAIAGENFEIYQMYPAYLAVAEMQQEKGAQTSMGWALEAEKIHAKLFSDAKDSVGKGEDILETDIQICSICGYTGLGEAPSTCPICGAKQEKFVVF